LEKLVLKSIFTRRILYFVVYTTLILSLYQSLRIDAVNYDLKLKRHTSIIDNYVEYPYKYRLINPYITNIYFTALKTFTSEKAAFLLSYFIQNIIIYFFLMFSLVYFFSLWLDEKGTLFALILYAFIIPLTLTGYDTLGDLTTAGLMALGFYFINSNKIKLLYPVVFIGAFNELQIIILILFYLVSSKSNIRLPKVWLNFALLNITFALSYLIIYYLRGGHAGQEDVKWYFSKDAAFNVSHPDFVLLWIVLIVPLLFYVFKNIKTKPEFLRNSFYIVLPLCYVLSFFFIARMREIDKALTIFTILIPLALLSITPEHKKQH
jgi:hypothetical protein